MDVVGRILNFLSEDQGSLIKVCHLLRALGQVTDFRDISCKMMVIITFLIEVLLELNETNCIVLESTLQTTQCNANTGYIIIDIRLVRF